MFSDPGSKSPLIGPRTILTDRGATVLEAFWKTTFRKHEFESKKTLM
jgi:hypothetical protein